MTTLQSNRRTFLASGAALSALAVLPARAATESTVVAQVTPAPSIAGWML